MNLVKLGFQVRITQKESPRAMIRVRKTAEEPMVIKSLGLIPALAPSHFEKQLNPGHLAAPGEQ